MTIQAFPTTPAVSYGVSSKKSFRVLSADFGDGYSQRTPDGLNNEIESISMVWNTLSYSDAAIITNFLDGCGGSQAFSYTPPGQAVSKNWTCPAGYTFKAQNASYTDLTATFVRVYDLS
jgi:phage-related protein